MFFFFFQPPDTEEDVLVVLQDYPSTGVSGPTYRLGEKLRLIAQYVFFFYIFIYTSDKKNHVRFDVCQKFFLCACSPSRATLICACCHRTDRQGRLLLEGSVCPDREGEPHPRQPGGQSLPRVSATLDTHRTTHTGQQRRVTTTTQTSSLQAELWNAGGWV